MVDQQHKKRLVENEKIQEESQQVSGRLIVNTLNIVMSYHICDLPDEMKKKR